MICSPIRHQVEYGKEAVKLVIFLRERNIWHTIYGENLDLPLKFEQTLSQTNSYLAEMDNITLDVSKQSLGIRSDSYNLNGDSLQANII